MGSMIILSKLADYAVIVATHLAAAVPAQVNAMQIAAETRLPPTTVAKVLKKLARAGIVTALRGASGGYRLARAPASISVAEIIAAIDGAFGMTQCTSGIGPCDRLHFCPTRPHWHRINAAVIQALSGVTLGEMTGGQVPSFMLPEFGAVPTIAERLPS
jgi:FeS assembly SUF system regulator